MEMLKCCGMCCGVFAAKKCCGSAVEMLKCCGVLLLRSAVECCWLEVLWKCCGNVEVLWSVAA